jgi:hypothetical protein
MKSVRGEFIRKLGCLRMHLQHLNENLRTNNLSGMEDHSKVIEDLLLDLVKSQRKLGKPEQLTMKPRFALLREEALDSLEIAQRILDDSLEATTLLLRTVQDAAGYGSAKAGASIIVDRKA